MNEFLKNAIMYEIYPTSFYDGNGDGVGDFIGMEEKLDYVKELGADILWINPFYLSPFRDGGYDVKDFRKVDPRFGTMADFENFIAKSKKLGIKVLVDLVIGHTSIEHRWFKQSAKSERNKYSDYFIWTDRPFSTYNRRAISGIYERAGGYYVNFFGCQPALNYGWNTLEEGDENNPEKIPQKWKMHYTDERLTPLRKEIINIMKFWLKKGVDGFRVDMACDMVKGIKYDDEDDDKVAGDVWFWNKVISEVKKSFPELIMLAEWSNPKVSVGKCGFDLDYFAHDTAEYDALLRCEKNTNISTAFENGHNYFSGEGKGDLAEFVKFSEKWYKEIEGKGFFSMPTGCHDEVRAIAGSGAEQMKCAFALLLTYRHFPMIYYGDEIGIDHNFSVSKDGGDIRTGCRTPMQWTKGKNRGFSTADEKDLYLPVNYDEGVDVETQEKDPSSLLNTVKKLIQIRKTYSCFNAVADIKFINTGYPFIFERKDEKYSATVFINPSDKTFKRRVGKGKTLAFLNCDVSDGEITLRGQSFAVILNGEK